MNPVTDPSVVVGFCFMLIGLWLCWIGFGWLENRRYIIGVLALFGMVVCVVVGLHIASATRRAGGDSHAAAFKNDLLLDRIQSVNRNTLSDDRQPQPGRHQQLFPRLQLISGVVGLVLAVKARRDFAICAFLCFASMALIVSGFR